MALLLRRPKKDAPRAMLKSVALNGVMQLVMAIVVLYHIGNASAVFAHSFPVALIFYQATGPSRRWTNLLVSVLIFQVFVAMINNFASTSRLVFSFAEDGGLPRCSRWISHAKKSEHDQAIHGQLTHETEQEQPEYDQTRRALYFVVFCVLLMGLFVFHPISFNALISLPLLALYASYFLVIMLLFIHRTTKGLEQTQENEFRLGGFFGPLNNIFSLCYLGYCIIFTSFPTSRHVAAKTFNYSPGIFMAVFAYAVSDFYIFSGHKRFKVKKVERDGTMENTELSITQRP